MSNNTEGFEVRSNFTKIPNELFQLYTRLPGFRADHVLMYAILVSYHNDREGYAYPDQEELSRRMNCHVNKVGKVGSKLREVGLVEYKRRSAGGNYVYFVKPPITDRETFFDTFPEAKVFEGEDVEGYGDSSSSEDKRAEYEDFKELADWF